MNFFSRAGKYQGFFFKCVMKTYKFFQICFCLHWNPVQWGTTVDPWDLSEKKKLEVIIGDLH